MREFTAIKDYHKRDRPGSDSLRLVGAIYHGYSTAEECLEFISKTITYGEHAKLANAEYLKNGIKNTYQIGEAATTMSWWWKSR